MSTVYVILTIVHTWMLWFPAFHPGLIASVNEPAADGRHLYIVLFVAGVVAADQVGLDLEQTMRTSMVLLLTADVPALSFQGLAVGWPFQFIRSRSSITLSTCPICIIRWISKKHRSQILEV